MIGQTISHYKIVEKLGEGGMGVVYKAQDTTLDRLVALKFLPARVSVSEETKARFLQEAKAAAALNHAHICTIHGVEEEAGQMFIVMEYIEGGTLREKLPFSKVNDVLSVAIQIGEALQEAHSKGIVHRDIKADNVMLTSKGQAKVMDFGLAKLKGSLKLTKTSSTVGTLAYMAPEQIQGSEVDARSDIFSFGVLLYEMLTGHLPFRGEHEAAVMYSIVNEEPTPLQQHVPEATSELVHIINRALEKDPEERYQFARDMVIDLRRLRKDTSRVSGKMHLPPVDKTEQAPSHFWSRKILAWSLGGIIIILGAAVALFILPQRLPRVNPKPDTNTLSLRFSQIGFGSLTADGNTIAFPAAGKSGMWDVYAMHPKGEEPRLVTTQSHTYIESAFISPDGNYIAFYAVDSSRHSKLMMVPTSGGKGRAVAENAYPMRWKPDGGRLTYELIRPPSRKQEIWSMKPDGSDAKLELRDEVGIYPPFNFSCSWSPDGSSIAYIRAYDGYREIVIRDLHSGKEKEITSDRKVIDEIIWTHQGAILYSSNKTGNANVWMIAPTGGESIPITSGEGPYMGSAISSDGKRFLYYKIVMGSDVWSHAVATGKREQITSGEGRYEQPRVSPDNKRIAMSMRDKDTFNYGSRLYIIELETKTRWRISPDDGSASWNRDPSWSPDGKHIAYVSAPVMMPSDSARVYISDVANPRPRLVHLGDAVTWLDNDNVLIHTKEGTSRSSISLQTTERFFADSTWAIPVLGGSHILYRDYREVTKGLWLTKRGLTASEDTQLILPANRFVDDWRLDQKRQTLYYLKWTGEIWKMDLATKKTEHVASIREMKVDFDVSEDRKMVVFTPWTLDWRSNMNVMENLFE